MTWQPIMAAAINTVIVLALVEVLKAQVPVIRIAMPWVLPVLATLAGPMVAVAQTSLAGWLNLPIDLSPLVAVLSGAAATTVHQVGRQFGTN